MHGVNPIYSNAVSPYFTQLNTLMIILLISIVVVHQNGFVLDRIINTYIIIIITITNTINNISMYKFNNSHKFCKLNYIRLVVFRLDKNVICVFTITRCDEFDADSYKTDVFHTILHKIHNFDAIVCIVKVNNCIYIFN